MHKEARGEAKKVAEEVAHNVLEKKAGELVGDLEHPNAKDEGNKALPSVPRSSSGEMPNTGRGVKRPLCDHNDDDNQGILWTF